MCCASFHLDVVCLLAAGNCVVITAAGRGERQWTAVKFVCILVASDQFCAESTDPPCNCSFIAASIWVALLQNVK